MSKLIRKKGEKEDDAEECYEDAAGDMDRYSGDLKEFEGLV